MAHVRLIEFGTSLTHHMPTHWNFLRKHAFDDDDVISVSSNLAVRRKGFRLMYYFMSTSC
jgi:hypothetical protein